MRVVSIGGYTDEVGRALVKGVSAEVEKHLDVPPARTYVELCAAERFRFGWNGAPFG